MALACGSQVQGISYPPTLASCPCLVSIDFRQSQGGYRVSATNGASHPASWAFPTENLLLAPFLNCVTPLGVSKKASSTSIFCLLVLFDFQLCFPAVKNICTDGSNWEFNNFLMFLVVFGKSTENETYFSSMFPYAVRKLSVLKLHRGFILSLSLSSPVIEGRLTLKTFSF